MSKSKFGIVIFVLLLTVPLVNIACGSPDGSSQKIGVVVSIMPQVEFMENVGGDKINITVMVPQKANPHTYEPTPKQMKALSQAQLYARVGSGIEFEVGWMDKMIAVNQTMLVVDCARNIQLIKMTAADPDEHKTSSGLDPHIWMSPRNARIMVSNICDGLSQVDPTGKAYYEQNRNLYLQKLTRLDQDIRNGLSKMKNRQFLVYHPAFGYFAHEYNLTMLTIEEQGKEPTAASIARVIQQAKDSNIKVVFALPQFNPQSARVIANSIGGRVVFIDDLSKDYISNLRSIVNQMVEVME